jgi:hypothetical protein
MLFTPAVKPVLSYQPLSKFWTVAACAGTELITAINADRPIATPELLVHR